MVARKVGRRSSKKSSRDGAKEPQSSGFKNQTGVMENKS
jgi:hypothetical protein